MFASRELVVRLFMLAHVLSIAACSGATTAGPSTTSVATTGVASLTPPPTASFTNTELPALQLAPPTNVATLSPSNSAIATTIARTPQPTPLVTPLPNETGIVPGQTQAEVQAALGQPQSKSRYRDMDIWKYRSPKIPTLLEVSFANGRVSEITVQAPSLTAEMVVTQYGVPEVVVFYPQINLVTPEPPPASPRGELVYPSKGLQFEFVCWPTRIPPCTGVPRDIDISVKFYFLPSTIRDWLGQQVLPPGRAELRPWTGFSD